MRKSNFVLLPVLLIATLIIAGCGRKEEMPAVEKEVTTAREAFLPAKRVSPTKEKAMPEVSMPAMRDEEAAGKELILADFDSGEKPNNIGGNFGGWDKDPADFSQGCAESFDTKNRRGPKGFTMKLNYDVDSKNPAYNGFWMFLQNMDASGYDNLSFWVKGDSEQGYTTVFKVELKNAARQVGRYYLTNVTDQWQEVVIPFESFKGITDFSNLSEFVIVFEDRIASNKDGVIYIDDVKITKR